MSMTLRETSLEASAVAWEYASGTFEDPSTGKLAKTLAAGMNGLLCAILATIPGEDEERTPLDLWARVELFGHTVRHGHVTEVKIAGKWFLQVLEPTLVHGSDGDQDATVMPEVRRLYHPNAVYGMTPLTKSGVMATLRKQKGLTFIEPEADPSDDIPF